ncbi:hypothetical protein RSAG8_03500, partial [Rhizoctonia solani AG-8 WAC10335]
MPYTNEYPLPPVPDRLDYNPEDTLHGCQLPNNASWQAPNQGELFTTGRVPQTSIVQWRIYRLLICLDPALHSLPPTLGLALPGPPDELKGWQQAFLAEQENGWQREKALRADMQTCQLREKALWADMQTLRAELQELQVKEANAQVAEANAQVAEVKAKVGGVVTRANEAALLKEKDTYSSNLHN